MVEMSFGAIFDWDGVVVDSSAYHKAAWELLGVEIGKSLPPDHFERAFGLKNETIIPVILDWTDDNREIQRLSFRKEELYREALAKGGLSPLTGVPEFLALLRSQEVPCAVGSSTHRQNIEVALALIGLRDSFQAIVAAEDVGVGKPDPEVFLRGAEQIGLPPERCVVFEDAVAGVEAAHRGGMKAIAVTTTHPASRLSAADLVVDRLDQVSIQAIRGLF
jgi:beta-phosphoglucomutase family hydrolase